jgi:hypothetical protein
VGSFAGNFRRFRQNHLAVEFLRAPFDNSIPISGSVTRRMKRRRIVSALNDANYAPKCATIDHSGIDFRTLGSCLSVLYVFREALRKTACESVIL